MTRSIAASIIAVMLALTVSAVADDGEGCRYSSRTAKDQIVAVCTRAISLPKYQAKLDWVSNFYKTRAEALAEAGKHAEALQDFAEAIRLGRRVGEKSEELRDAYYYRAQLHIKRKSFDLAIADLNETAKIRVSPSTIYSRAESYFGKGDFDRAIADYNETLKLDPDYKLAFKYRALSYEQKGDLARALADAQKALALEQASGYSGYSEQDIIKRLVAKGAAVPSSSAGSAVTPPSSAAVRPVQPQVQPQARPQAVPPVAPPATRPQVAAAPPSPPPAAVPAPPLAATPAGKRVALVIGNAAYAHSPRLANPANDAADVAAALRRLGFEVVEGRDLDKRGMEDRMREFGRRLDRAGLALFFYAGHGLQIGGKNYLVPIDAKLERAGDLTLDAVDVAQVLAQMEAEQRVNLVFLDACRDNPLARSFARSLGTRSTAVGQGLATIQSAIGTMISFATQPDNVALDGEGRNSPFTTALLRHLATPNQDIGVVMRRVRADVVQSTNGRQVPWDHSSLIGEVVLMR